MKEFCTTSEQKYRCFSRLLFFVLISIIVNILSGGIVYSDQSVKKVNVTFSGNKFFSEDELNSLIRYRPGEDFRRDNLETGIRNIIGNYQSSGFVYTDIDTVWNYGKENNLEVVIHEGPRVIIGSINVIGLEEDESLDLREIEKPEGSYYNQTILNNYVNGIIRYLADNGYPYVLSEIVGQKTLPGLLVGELLLDLTIEFTLNKKAKFDRLDFNGLEYTKHSVITRESRLKEGQDFEESKIEKAADYITQLSYIDAVTKTEVYEDEEGKTVISFDLEEKNSNNFNGIVGYIPARNAEKGYYIGNFRLDLGNVFGTGRIFKANWIKEDNNSQDISLYYEEPWIMGHPVNLLGGFQQVLQDSIYIKRKFTAGAKYNFSGRLYAQLDFGIENVIAEDLGFIHYGVRNSESRYYRAGVSFNKLNNTLNPRNGIYYQSFVTEQYRKFESNEDYNDRKIEAELQSALPLRRNLILHTKLAWKQISNSDDSIPVNEKWYIGGANSLRGYREKQFLAAKITWFNLELRYLFEEMSRIFVFLDGGALQDPGSDTIKKYGYGFGMRINTRLGLTGFDFGLGKGDSFSSAKLHFIIQNSF